MITTIRLTDKDLADKNTIEQSLDGAKLTHHAIYTHGLISLKHLMEKRVKVELAEKQDLNIIKIL